MPTNFKKMKIHKKTKDVKRVKKHPQKPALKLSRVTDLTKKTANLLWANRKIFGAVAIFYILAVVLIVNVISESSYSTIKLTANASLSFITGSLGDVFKAGVLSISALTGGFISSSSSSTTSQFFSFVILLITWLSVVWMLRNILAKRKFKLRDALYNCCAPLIPTFLVGVVGMLELLPAVLGVVIYMSALETSFISQTVGAIIVPIVSLALVALSVYWIIGIIFSFVVVSLPGMYPIKAIKTGHHLASGRRIALIGRFLWALLLVVATWLVVLIPLILFDNWIKGAWMTISWLPFIPIMVVILGAFTAVWLFAYIYLLYREIVDGESARENQKKSE